MVRIEGGHFSENFEYSELDFQSDNFMRLNLGSIFVVVGEVELQGRGRHRGFVSRDRMRDALVV